MDVLLCNAGSSSLKCTVAEAGTGNRILTATVEWAGKKPLYRLEHANREGRCQVVDWRHHADTIPHLMADLCRDAVDVLGRQLEFQAVGHRIVHGGVYTRSMRVTPELLTHLEGLADLAPLQNPPGLAILKSAMQLLAEVPHIAIFDTAFHATLPQRAFTYPIPRVWTEEWGIRRYGFHGLSHAYCSQRGAELLDRPIEQLRLVTCHLGHGCSAAAIARGECCDTTMGFTPMEGLMMATRCGSIDPGILPHVQRVHGITASEIEDVLNHQSGLLGVSQVSADMRDVLAASAAGNSAAELAVAIYTHRVRQAIGSFIVTLGGIDGLIFTAGVGEHSAEIRHRICQGLAFLGLEIDAVSNTNCVPDCDIATPTSAARILVIRSREDCTMLREVGNVLRGS
jgi:acetate kinase